MEGDVKTGLPNIIAGIFFFSAILIAATGHDSVAASNTATVKKMKCTHVSVKAISPDTAKQKEKTPVAVSKAAQDTLIIIARLIEIPGKFPSNDAYDYIYLVKYRVIKVLRGVYPVQEILVGHYNPRIPRSQIKDRMAPFVAGNVTKFETGDKHRLVLITPLERVIEDRVENDFPESDLEKYYALRADVAQ
jgi:hypothetical protein